MLLNVSMLVGAVVGFTVVDVVAWSSALVVMSILLCTSVLACSSVVMSILPCESVLARSTALVVMSMLLDASIC